MKKVIGTKGFRVEMMKFKTGKKDKSGAPIFEERVVRNFCSLPKDRRRKMEVYHITEN